MVKLFDDALPTGTYSHIFRNEIGIGRMHYSGNVYENFVPALATMEHWEAVQSLHYKRPARGQPHPKDNSHPKAGCGQHLLSGLCRFYRELKKTNLRVDEKLIIRELTEMKNTLGRGELKARKLVLKRVVDKIEVGRDVARLHYKFPLYNLLLERVRGLVSKVRQDDLMLVEL